LKLLGGGEPGIAAAAEASAAVALADLQAAWRAGKTPARGVRAVKGSGMTRGRGRSWRWPAAVKNSALRWRQRRQEAEQRGRGARRKNGERMKLGTALQN
jgi:hypothetical protein